MDDRDTAALQRNWWLVTLRGAAAIVFGILTFITPGITLAVLVLLFGAYALADGLLNLVAVFRRRREEQPWWTLLVEGLVSIAAGAVTFAWPGLTAVALVYLIAAWAIVTGAFALGAAIRLRKEITGEVWLALSGVLSIVFGVFVMFAPGAGALAMTLWIGAYAIVFGATLVGLGFRLRSRREDARHPMARAA
jgi:uncharacterized membrane protein HdeD (DUF308 family)